MKHEINGEINGRHLVDVVDEIECVICNATRFMVCADGLRNRANTIMHLAADMHANAERLAKEFNSENE